MGKIKAPAYAAYSYLNLRYSLYKLLHVTSWHQLTGQWNFIQTKFSHLHSFKNSISFTQMIKLAHLRSVFQQYKKHSENQLKCFLEKWDNEHSIQFYIKRKKNNLERQETLRNSHSMSKDLFPFSKFAKTYIIIPANITKIINNTSRNYTLAETPRKPSVTLSS